MTETQPGKKIARCVGFKFKSSDLPFIDELFATWFAFAPAEPLDDVSQKPILVPLSVWEDVAEELLVVTDIWSRSADEQKALIYPMEVDIKPYVKPTDPFYISTETWAQVAAFLEMTFDYYATELFAGTSTFLPATMIDPDHKPETIQAMIDKTDALCPDFWPKWFCFQAGALFYDSISKDCLLPLAHRMWKHFYIPGQVCSFRGTKGEIYYKCEIPIAKPELKDKAPQIYTFYQQCFAIAQKATISKPPVGLQKCPSGC
jgi:hypothetical protein